MKKLFLILLMLLFVIPLVGCSKDDEEDPTIYEGMVVDKIFDEGYSYTRGYYAGKVWVTQVHHVPDRYYVVIYKDEKIAKHSVSKKFYDNFTIGSVVVVGQEDLDDAEEEVE